MTRRLPNRITDDIELDQWCRSRIVGFAGIVDRTKFPALFQKIRPGQSAIINLDPGYKNGGTHWVAAKLSNQKWTDPDGFRNNVLLYADSFGAPPPTDVIAAARGRRMRVLYPNNVLQKINESNCGRRSAEWLLKFDTANDVDQMFELYE